MTERVNKTSTERFNRNGIQFTQYMDLDDDSAFYHNEKGELLMKVNSSGDATDKDGKLLGHFKMQYPKDTWKFVHEDGREFPVDSWKLFEVVEPYVVGALFGTC